MTRRKCSVEFRGKVVFFIIENESDVIQSELLKGSFYEQEELSIIESHFDGGVFVDLGANIGNHSIFVASFLSPERVVSVEANPETFSLLRSNITMNNLDYLIETGSGPIAVGDRAGYGSIDVPKNNLGGARVHCEDSESSASIRIAKADDLLSNVRPSFIKIDVEGMEMEVLDGLSETINRCRPKIFIEVMDWKIDSLGDWTTKNDYKIIDSYKRYPNNTNFLLCDRNDQLMKWAAGD